jgi:hypothetical protein
MGNVALVAPDSVINGDGQADRKWKVDGCEQRQGMAVKVGQDESDMEIPRGAIMLWYGTEDTIPQGWVPCDGRRISYVDSNTGSELSFHIVPDMRGRMATSLGFSQSEQTHLSGDKIGKDFITIPKHVHVIRVTTIGGSQTVFGYPDNNSFTKNLAPPPTDSVSFITETEAIIENNKTYSQIPSCISLFYIFRAY